MQELSLLLKDYRLFTMEILYGMPDYPLLVQTFTMQEYDIAPDFPRLNDFLDFWQREIEARIRRVRVTQVGLVQPTTYSNAGGGIFRLQ